MSRGPLGTLVRVFFFGTAQEVWSTLVRDLWRVSQIWTLDRSSFLHASSLLVSKL